MRLQSLVVALVVVVAGAFVLLNQDLVVQTQTVRLPGARVTAPILGITLVVAVGALVGLLLLRIVEGFSLDRAQRRMYQRLAQREHEIAMLKSAAYDRVGAMVEAIHREVSTWIAGEARRQEHLQAQLAALQRPVPAPAVAEADRAAEVRRVPVDREAA
jgi:hypothetical protein